MTTDTAITIAIVFLVAPTALVAYILQWVTRTARDRAYAKGFRAGQDDLTAKIVAAGATSRREQTLVVLTDPDRATPTDRTPRT